MSLFKLIGFACTIGAGFLLLLYRRHQAQNRALIHNTRRGSNETRRSKFQCLICLEEVERPAAITLSCKHTYCSDCLKRLISGTQTTCCYCRREIPEDELYHLKAKLSLPYFS